MPTTCRPRVVRARATDHGATSGRHAGARAKVPRGAPSDRRTHRLPSCCRDRHVRCPRRAHASAGVVRAGRRSPRWRWWCAFRRSSRPVTCGFDDGVYGVHGARHARRWRARSTTCSHRKVRCTCRSSTSATCSGSARSNAPRVAPVLAGIVVTLAVWGAGRTLGATRCGAALAARPRRDHRHDALDDRSDHRRRDRGRVRGDCRVGRARVPRPSDAGARRRDRARDGRRAHGEGARRPGRDPVGWWLWSAPARARPRRSRSASRSRSGSLVDAPVGLRAGLRAVGRVPPANRSPVRTGRPAAEARHHAAQPRSPAARRRSRSGSSRRSSRTGASIATPTRCHRSSGSGAGTLFCSSFEPAMFRNHIASLDPAARPARRDAAATVRWAVVAAIFVVPWWAAHLDDVLWPRDYRGAEAALDGRRPRAARRRAGDHRRAGLRVPRGSASARESQRRVDQAHRPGHDHDRARRRRRGVEPRGLRGRDLVRPVRTRAARPAECAARRRLRGGRDVRRCPQPVAQAAAAIPSASRTGGHVAAAQRVERAQRGARGRSRG